MSSLLLKTTGGIGCAVLALPLLAALAIAALLGGGVSAAPSQQALTDIPPSMLALYQQAAAQCPGLPWTILAAIGKVETDHARNPDQLSSAGAVGPMQFLPSTFRAYAYPVPPGGKMPPTPWDPVDAVYAATRLLCANGADWNLRGAVYAFNHDADYTYQVLHIAATYAAGGQPAGPGGALRVRTWRAAIAIAFARAQIGRPYQWGGDGPARRNTGFDCSGLTQAAYAAAGIPLPRVAQDQYNTSPRVPDGEPLLPGDLVFYGTPSHVHHVGIYEGNGLMIDAPRPHHVIREEPFRFAGDDYLGAVRPSDARP
ncbi:bifunctional lytic transglycosylase/C40 family peptidase [Streptomyces sp. RB6PN25]|uniref:Bifunctional lytic transglycosylase/C40 family peptidase n=1 Tax=Streptomyces humicola TaxID=2953240 RepID=A0ABT1PVZ3_9ACTN|nr:bifunctional lytic transglycosylase/C40 family peptidase [Streptomyces humicola]MCQ4081838.1 bifunctional lytic transglycosylase/C40 family peptidase [Streptomyces humicola]